jgi:hypothetical protein
MNQGGSISESRCKRLEEYLAMKIRTTSLNLWNMFVVNCRDGRGLGRLGEEAGEGVGEGGGGRARGPKVNPKLWVMHLITTLSISFAIWQHCILAIHRRIPTVNDFLIHCQIIIQYCTCIL